MDKQYDTEMTEDRKKQVADILQALFEDQYNCKLIRLPISKEGAPA